MRRCLLLALTLVLFTPTALALPVEECQSPEDTANAVALAAVGITKPGLALQGVGRSAAAQGGEWVVATWRPCVDWGDGLEEDLPTTVTLHHKPAKADARLVASLKRPPVERFVRPSKPEAVVQGPWGPLLLIDVATGSNCYACERLLPLRLVGKKLIPVQPKDDRIVLGVLIASSPDLIIGAGIDTFESYGVPHAFSPINTVDLKLEKDGRLSEVCDRYKDEYARYAQDGKDDLATIAQDLTENTAPGDLSYSTFSYSTFSVITARTLNRLNAGEALSDVLPEFQSVVKNLISLMGEAGREIDLSAKALETELISANNTGRLDRSCPVLGVKRPSLH